MSTDSADFEIKMDELRNLCMKNSEAIDKVLVALQATQEIMELKTVRLKESFDERSEEHNKKIEVVQNIVESVSQKMEILVLEQTMSDESRGAVLETINNRLDVIESNQRTTKISKLKQRRSTINALNSDDNVDDEEDIELDGKRTNVVASEYKPTELMTKLTMRALLKFIHVYREYKYSALDKSKNFVNFVGREILEIIVYNERHLKTAISGYLNMESIYAISDNNLISAFARALRPQTRSEYIRQMFSGVTKFKPKGTWDKDFPHVNWDRIMAIPVSKVCQEFGEIDSIWRRDLTEKDPVDYPTYTWGTAGMPGVFMILFECFGHCKGEMINGAGGIDAIKAMKTFEEVESAIMKFNSDYSKAALIHRSTVSKSKTLGSLSEVYQQETERIGSQLVKFPEPKSDTSVRMGAMLDTGAATWEVQEDVDEDKLMVMGKTSVEKPTTQGPCFRMLNMGKCEVPNCHFSHEDRVIEAEADRLLSESPVFRKALNKQRLPEKVKTQYSPLKASPAFKARSQFGVIQQTASDESEEA
jgi:hypothetical protein